MDENRTYFDHTNRELHPQSARELKLEKRSKKGAFFGGVLTGLAVALLMVAVVYIGGFLQNDAMSAAGGSNVEFSEDSAITPELVNKLQALEKTIDAYFYLEEVSDEEFQDSIYKGLLQALNDPYSEYYTAEELNDLLQQVEGTYYGIGAYVSLDTVSNFPKISGTIKGAPAEEVDLRANDLIYEVDGVSTYGMTLTEVVALIKGPENTEVVLTIVRDGEDDYLYITVTRGEVETPTIEYEMLDDGMAYIQIIEFDEVSVKQFSQALKDAKTAGMKGLIFDVRANPGGSLDAVVEMLRMILPEGMIVYTKDKYGQGDTYTCDGKNELEVPLVLLVDMNSASASEIMAAAIKEHGIGTLVGTTTFGKGIVQQIVPFRDGSAIKVTISSYFTPNGNDIHGIGVEPDVVCEFDGEAYYGSEDHPDNQLEKAKEVLKDLMSK